MILWELYQAVITALWELNKSPHSMTASTKFISKFTCFLVQLTSLVVTRLCLIYLWIIMAWILFKVQPLSPHKNNITPMYDHDPWHIYINTPVNLSLCASVESIKRKVRCRRSRQRADGIYIKRVQSESIRTKSVNLLCIVPLLMSITKRTRSESLRASTHLIILYAVFIRKTWPLLIGEGEMLLLRPTWKLKKRKD